MISALGRPCPGPAVAARGVGVVRHAVHGGLDVALAVRQRPAHARRVAAARLPAPFPGRHTLHGVVPRGDVHAAVVVRTPVVAASGAWWRCRTRRTRTCGAGAAVAPAVRTGNPARAELRRVRQGRVAVSGRGLQLTGIHHCATEASRRVARRICRSHNTPDTQNVKKHYSGRHH